MNNSLENQSIIEIEEFEELIKEGVHWLFKLYNFIIILDNNYFYI